MPSPEGSAKTRGLFVVGGVVKSRLTDGDQQVLVDHLSSLLQVHNLVILVGSGASMHLGSPSTRNLPFAKIAGLIEQAGAAVSVTDEALLRVLNPRDDGDLERLLNALQLAADLASHTGSQSISLGDDPAAASFAIRDVAALRAKIANALARACDLPGPPDEVDPGYRDDPLLAHRTFFSRVVRSRRSNLPRPRVFTTNYDLVIERALDQLGYPYIDGFSGTVDRRLNMANFGLDFHRVDRASQDVLARAEGTLYLHKIHGSLNWRAVSGTDAATGVDLLDVHQVPGDGSLEGQRVLIYPTTAKEGDTLAYPYSDLMRLLGDAVERDDTAIISVGYGFADAHINRILLRSLSTNPALNVFIADPYAVLDKLPLAAAIDDEDLVGTPLRDSRHPARDTPVGKLARADDSRVAVLTGEAGKFTRLAEALPDPAIGRNVTAPATISALIEALGGAPRAPEVAGGSDD